MAVASNQEFVYCWFVPLFICFWLFLSAFLSFVGGWQTLAKHYRSKRRRSGELFSFSTMILGSAFFPMSYRACMMIRIDSEGIALSVFPLFRFFHPSLFIPWNAVVACRQERFWLLKCATLELTEPQLYIRFLGKVGEEIIKLWNENESRNIGEKR
jgi:hypothetical protein